MRKFKDGEMVRVKKTGEIGKITCYKVFNGTGYYEVDNEIHFMGRFRPQELEKYEDCKKLNFKIGDRIEIIGLEHGEICSEPLIGLTGIIIKDSPTGCYDYYVKFDKELPPDFKVFRDNGRWVTKKMITLIEPKKEVKITQTDNVITATLTENGKEVKTATAKCSPDDEFNYKKGVKLAVNRLFANPKFKVGDKVEIKKCSNYVSKKGIIIGISDDYDYLVDFGEEVVFSHNGKSRDLIFGNYSKNKTCIYFSEYELELIPKTKRVFSKFKFIKDMGIDFYEINSGWVNICNGNDIIDGRNVIGNDGNKYISFPDWEIEVPVE